MPGISPTRGEIGCRECFRQSSTLKNVAPEPKLPISPLVGEMSGRTEGGAVE
ncbi:propionyl-coenzyme A carboxylase alpha polypeptide [Mesorhizobium sp. B2-8-1]|nr:propionyl-coenzyme A carboxylase alpha polypeptide [Mesorhizobium sp. B2-8-1]TPK35289.1 propionyl-coenzyme A carboxylase alpha polypeptide [Mesorhizobium sp. B2-5-3]TPL32167.1 propionyl-coenzyme A carboxylase alpha polypeptide [Mesorhizobium sp. B2-4-8]TPL60827.1 propionyl-coenzyme A carboxylase alpha polypeptide [Mesorhizobium sp. B2-4-1]